MKVNTYEYDGVNDRLIWKGLADMPLLTNTTDDRALREKAEKDLAKDPSRGILNVRGSTHGDFKENGEIMQALKELMRAHRKWLSLHPYQQEALEMIQHKIGRILCGDSDYYDHWRDIAGYAKLVEERCPQPNGDGSIKRVS